MFSLYAKRWNSTAYEKPRASLFWLTLATIGDSRMSSRISTFCGVAGSPGIEALSQAVAAPPGVVASPSPVCQMPNLFTPPVVWNPHRPEVLYSHRGLTFTPAAMLAG